MSTLPQPSGVFTQEEALDMLAYVLCTSPISSVSGIQWILGDVGMGAPDRIPFAYISPTNETVQWFTANGRPAGGGGGGIAGVDDWLIPITLTIACAPHDYLPPITGAPPAGSPFTAAALASGGFSPATYKEQPTFRLAMQVAESVKATLRLNITLGGEVITTRVTESRYMLVSIQGKGYRCMRITLTAQQRRKRGN